MDPVTTLLGAAAIIFGVYTLYVRSTDPAKLGKLRAMKKQFGDSTGNVIHFVAYSLVPIAAGIVFLVTGLGGGSIF